MYMYTSNSILSQTLELDRELELLAFFISNTRQKSDS